MSKQMAAPAVLLSRPLKPGLDGKLPRDEFGNVLRDAAWLARWQADVWAHS